MSARPRWTSTGLSQSQCFRRSEVGLVPRVAKLIFANIFIPYLGVSGDVPRQQFNALFRLEVDHLHAILAKPVNAALKVDRLADDHRSDSKLANQTAAVPTRRKSCHHDFVAVAVLAAGVAKGVGLAVYG